MSDDALPTPLGCRMQRRHRAVVAIILILGVAGAAAQQPPPETLREIEREALIERHRALLAPAPLPPETLLAWAEDSGLDETQRQALKETIDAYALRLPALEKDLRSKVLELWPASFEFDRDARAVVPVYAPPLLELYELQARLIERVLALERPIVMTIAAQADPAQRAVIDTAWLARLRRLRGLTEPAPTVHTLDPTALVDRLALADAERQRLDPLIEQYRRDLISALEGRGTLAPLEAEANVARALVELGPAWELFFDAAEIAAIESRMHSSGAQPMLDRALELNHQFIREAAELLPPRKSLELRSLYFQQLLPDFFEEEREMLAIADAVAAVLEEIEGDEGIAAREGLDRALLAAAEDLDPTAESAVALEEDARAAAASPIARSRNREAAIRFAMTELERERALLQLRRDRRQVIDRAIESLQVAAQMTPEHAEWRERFEMLRRIQKAREEADEFRQSALADRLAGLDALLRERDGDR